jgi:hypothetical protein
MAVDWKEVNERRIGEKTQEILLYCAQKKTSMTQRAFELARLSFEGLLDNIAQRNPRLSSIIDRIRSGIASQEDCIAICTEKQAASLAKGVVYNYIGDDLNLYPITAEKKLLRAKARKLSECSIDIDEMTVKDIIYVASAITEGENFSKQTMRAVYEWFQQIGLNPIQTRVYSVLFMKAAPMSLKSIPQQTILTSEYRKAAKELVAKGFIAELPGDEYCITETTIE